MKNSRFPLWSIPARFVLLCVAAFAVLFAVPIASGCAATQPAELAFVQYFDATGGEYIAYVNADPQLTEQQKGYRRSSVSAAGDFAADIRRRQMSPIPDAGVPPTGTAANR